MVGRVSYLGRVKQGNYKHPCIIYHTEPKLHTSQTLSFHNNLPYLPPYFGYPDWESVTLCKYQHYPTLYITFPYPSSVIPYPSTYPTQPTVGKIPLPTFSIYSPTPSTSPQRTYLYAPHNTFYYIPQPAFPYPILLPGLNKI